MISLNIQFKLIVFSFIFGFMFSIVLDLFDMISNRISKVLNIVLSFLLILLMTFIYFIGIQKIGNAIFHVYSIISIIIGFILYDVVLKLIANTNKK